MTYKFTATIIDTMSEANFKKLHEVKSIELTKTQVSDFLNAILIDSATDNTKVIIENLEISRNKRKGI